MSPTGRPSGDGATGQKREGAFGAVVREVRCRLRPGLAQLYPPGVPGRDRDVAPCGRVPGGPDPVRAVRCGDGGGAGDDDRLSGVARRARSRGAAPLLSTRHPGERCAAAGCRRLPRLLLAERLASSPTRLLRLCSALAPTFVRLPIAPSSHTFSVGERPRAIGAPARRPARPPHGSRSCSTPPPDWRPRCPGPRVRRPASVRDPVP